MRLRPLSSGFSRCWSAGVGGGLGTLALGRLLAAPQVTSGGRSSDHWGCPLGLAASRSATSSNLTVRVGVCPIHGGAAEWGQSARAQLPLHTPPGPGGGRCGQGVDQELELPAAMGGPASPLPPGWKAEAMPPGMGMATLDRLTCPPSRAPECPAWDSHGRRRPFGGRWMDCNGHQCSGRPRKPKPQAQIPTLKASQTCYPPPSTPSSQGSESALRRGPGPRLPGFPLGGVEPCALAPEGGSLALPVVSRGQQWRQIEASSSSPPWLRAIDTQDANGKHSDSSHQLQVDDCESLGARPLGEYFSS